MNCPRCGALINPTQHGDLIFDGHVWCQGCLQYDDRLLELRPFPELENWAQQICKEFGQEPVRLRHDPDYLPDPSKYWDGNTFLLAEALHVPRCIMLFPPGQRLKTLCHELAHLFTGHDHTVKWAQTFAALIAWVKVRV